MTRLAFLITNRYQIHHYRPISAALGPATFVVETRPQDFAVDEAFIHRHVPGAAVEQVPKRHLKVLDGRFDVMVCQTPVLLNALLERTMVVAQQYSLGKEAYQYGVWRSMAAVNLMYGPYSVASVAGFANACAVGNPLLDGLLAGGLPPAPGGEPARGLYLPTYGSLSSLREVAPRLAGLPVTVKLHHAEDPAVAATLPPDWTVADPGASPGDLLRDADFVVTDFSGAAFDALYARKPLLLVGDADPAAADYPRLSAADLDRSHVTRLAARWAPGRPLGDAFAEARERLGDDRAYHEFVDRFFVNPGAAGPACAAAIADLVENGEPADFGRSQVRRHTREHVAGTRRLEAEVTRLGAENRRLRRGRPHLIGDAVSWSKRKARRLLARYPRLERRALDAWRGLVVERRRPGNGGP